MLQNVKIGLRLTIGFSLLLLITVLLGGTAIQSTGTLSSLTTNLYEHPFRVIQALLEMRAEITAIQRDVRDAVLATDKTSIGRIAERVARSEKIIADRLAIAKQQFLGDESDFTAARDAIEGWKPTYTAILSLTQSDKRDEAVALMKEKGAPQIALVNQRMDKCLEFARNKATSFMENAKASSKQIDTLTIGLLTGSVLLALTVAFITTRGITGPLSELNSCMTGLASGNVKTEVPALKRKDEIGAMAQAVEVFKKNAIDRMRLEAEQKESEARVAAERKAAMHQLANEFEAAVGDIVENVSSASTELEASANTLTKSAETTQQLSGNVAAASEQASANVQSVASATDEMASSVNEIGRQVQESSRIAVEAVKQAETTDARIAELSQAASRIGDVVKLITAIAEQTNLLALNATIEAARAGEAGRGFAVVAQEVKALAAQTAKATGEIGTQIVGMQTATQGSVAAIKEIGGTINRISEIASVIAAAVEEQSAATHEISRNVQQAAQGTAQVATNITDVHRGAGETGAASAQVLSSAQSLSSESNHLKLEVQKFLSTVRAA